MYKTGGLKKSEIESLIDLLVIAFATKAQKSKKELKEMFSRSVKLEPYLNLNNFRVIRCDNKLVSCLHVHRRPLHFKGKSLLMGGIGGVATHPDHRGKGLVRQLLNEATEYIERNKYDLSILFGEPVVYEKSGWHTLSSYNLTSDLPLKTVKNVKVKRGSFSDLKLLSRLYNEFNKTCNGTVIRNLKYWECWVKKVYSVKHSFEIYLVERDKQVIGYFLQTAPGRIIEMAYKSNKADNIDYMISGIHSKLKKGDHDLNFSFYFPELFEALQRMSTALHLDQIREKKYGLKVNVTYEGLCKYIGGNKGNLKGVQNTDELISLMRQNNYNAWPADHF